MLTESNAPLIKRPALQYYAYEDLSEETPTLFETLESEWLLHMPLPAPQKTLSWAYIGKTRLLFCDNMQFISVAIGAWVVTELERLASSPSPMMLLNMGSSLDGLLYDDVAVVKVMLGNKVVQRYPSHLGEMLYQAINSQVAL